MLDGRKCGLLDLGKDRNANQEADGPRGKRFRSRDKDLVALHCPLDGWPKTGVGLQIHADYILIENRRIDVADLVIRGEADCPDRRMIIEQLCGIAGKEGIRNIGLHFDETLEALAECHDFTDPAFKPSGNFLDPKGSLQAGLSSFIALDQTPYIVCCQNTADENQQGRTCRCERAAH